MCSLLRQNVPVLVAELEDGWLAKLELLLAINLIVSAHNDHTVTDRLENQESAVVLVFLLRNPDLDLVAVLGVNDQGLIVALDLVLVLARLLDLGGIERDVGVLADVEKVRRPQVFVPLGIPRVDGCGPYSGVIGGVHDRYLSRNAIHLQSPLKSRFR